MKFFILLFPFLFVLNGQADFRYIYQNNFFSEAQHAFQGSDTSWTVLCNTEEENGSYFVFTIDTNKNVLNQFRHNSPFYYNGKRIYEYNDSIYVFGNTNSDGGNKIFIHSYNSNFVFASERIIDLNLPSVLNTGHQNKEHIVLGGSLIDTIQKGFLIHFNTLTGNILTFNPQYAGRTFNYEAVLVHNDSIFAGGNIQSPTHQSSNILLSAFDLSFNLNWTYEEDSVLDEGITCLDTFPNGQIIAGGFYHEIGNDSKNVLGLRWNRNGDYKTRIKYSNPKDEFVKNIYTNYDQNIIFLIETHKGNIWLSNGEYGPDGFLLKVNDNGGFISGKPSGEVKPDYLNFALLCNDGGVLYCFGTESFNVGSFKPLVAKTKQDGNWNYGAPAIVSIKEIDELSYYKTFPNPSNHGWHVHFNDSNTKSLILFNALGQVISKQNYNTSEIYISNENLVPGIYYLIIQSKDYTQKVALTKS